MPRMTMTQTGNLPFTRKSQMHNSGPKKQTAYAVDTRPMLDTRPFCKH